MKTGTSDSRKEWFAVGDYKKRPNEVGGMETALPEEVAGRMKKLLTEYNLNENKTLEDILGFHVSFEKIPGIFDVLVLGVLHLLEVVSVNQALPRDRELPFVGDLQWHVAERRDVVGDILANLAIPSGGCLDQLAIFIAEFDGQAVQLQHEQSRSHGKHSNQIIGLLGLVHAQERNRVPDLPQRTHRSKAYRLRGGVAENDSRFLLQRCQFVKEPVVNRIGHAGLCEIVIFMPIAIERCSQLSDSLDAGTIRF